MAIGSVITGLHLDEARGVPEFGAEVSTDLELVIGQEHVLPGGRNHDQAEAQGVSAELVDDRQRINRVTQALAHLAALVIAHGAVDVHVGEGNVIDKLDARHHHPRDPEEDDLRGRHQVLGRVKPRQVFALRRPTERAERPEPRGEPGVEHILILTDVGRPAGRAVGGRALGRPFVVAGVAVKHGNTVSPPDLTRDAPVADVLHPFLVNLGPAVRGKGDSSVGDGGQGGLGQGCHLDEPLR